jgi:hypothetical protein
VVTDRHNSYPEIEAVFSSETPQYFYYTAHRHNKKDPNIHRHIRQKLRYRRDEQIMITIIRLELDGHK